MRRTVIQSPGRGSERPRAANNSQSHKEELEPTMATPGLRLDALANLQAGELKKLIESLQGLAASRIEGTPTLTTPQRPPIPDTAAGEEEAIMWEQVGTGHFPLPESPPTRPPPHHNPNNERTLEDQTINNPPKTNSTLAEICSRQPPPSDECTDKRHSSSHRDGGAHGQERPPIPKPKQRYQRQ